MKADIDFIKRSKKIYIFTDATNNLHEIDAKNYNKLLINNISETCKKFDSTIFNKINRKAKNIAERYDKAKRVDYFAKSNAFVTLKDHKENFQSKPKCRLINPAKSEIGKVSKFFIENINTKVREMSSVNQWRDTDSVITWFESIKNKNKCIFMQYDIEGFYPSISEDLFKKSINHARTFGDIRSDEEETILHSRKSLLFNNSDIWIKKEDNKGFDITMGSFGGAKICELVGLHILHILSTTYGRNHNGIYRGDGLACFENIGDPKADQIRKDFIYIFRKEFQLSIACKTNLKILNFLDVTLYLTAGKCKSYNKADNIPLYINVKSNHPRNIIKNLPESISRRINKLSSDKSVFDNSKDLYNNALSSMVLKIKSNLIQTLTRMSVEIRTGKEISYGPIFHIVEKFPSTLVKTFLTILDRHFPKSHKLYKIFNRNSVKICYSSLPNFAGIINPHNKNIIYNNITKLSAPTYNCRLKTLWLFPI